MLKYTYPRSTPRMDKEWRGENWLLPAGLKMFQEERTKKIADGIFMAVFLETDLLNFFTKVREKKTWKTSRIAQHYSPFLWTGFGKTRGVDSFLMSRRGKSDGPSWIGPMQVLTSHFPLRSLRALLCMDAWDELFGFTAAHPGESQSSLRFRKDFHQSGGMVVGCFSRA